jgi:hypothetical protein
MLPLPVVWTGAVQPGWIAEVVLVPVVVTGLVGVTSFWTAGVEVNNSGRRLQPARDTLRTNKILKTTAINFTRFMFHLTITIFMLTPYY